MNKRIPTRKRAYLLMAAGVLLALAATAAYAAIPSANGVISACTDNKGVLKIIDAEAGQTCSGNQQPLTWNHQGPVGPVGPQGPQGARGPSDGYFAKANAFLATDGTETTVATLDLPGGMYLAFARVEILSGDIGCELRGGGDDDGTILYNDPPAGVGLTTESATLMIPVTFVRGDTVKVVCRTYFDTDPHRVWARISAIKVATLTTS